MGPKWGDAFDSIALISIHPSRVGWDIDDGELVGVYDIFQSTHPVWDGTINSRIRI